MEIVGGQDLAKKLGKKLKADIEKARKKSGIRIKLAVLHDQATPGKLFFTREVDVWQKLGIEVQRHIVTESNGPKIRRIISQLNADPQITGFLIHWPLQGVSEGLFDLTEAIEQTKDIDGLHPRNRLYLNQNGFRPAFIMALDVLRSERKIEFNGRTVCIVGRSDFVGKPLAAYFLREGATVTICHRQTIDLHRHTREAEIVVLAAGSRNIIGAAHVSAGALIIDVGATVAQTADGPKLLGDANESSLAAKNGMLIPASGGFGPLVPYMTARNALSAALLKPLGDAVAKPANLGAVVKSLHTC